MVKLKASQQVEVATGTQPAAHRLEKRLLRLERLVAAIEDELSDESLTDEQKLDHVGERVAAVTDGR